MEPQVNTGLAYTGVAAVARSNRREHFKGVASRKLGIAQLTIGILCVVLQITWLFLVSDDIIGHSVHSDSSGPAYVSSGIWCGVLFIVAGVLAIQAAKHKTVCYIVVLMVWSIVCASFTIALLSSAAAGILSENQNRYDYVNRKIPNDYHFDYNDYPSPPPMPPPKNGSYATTPYPPRRWDALTRDLATIQPEPEPEPTPYRRYDNYYYEYVRVSRSDGSTVARMILICILLCLSIVEAILAIWTSALCCAAVCCCRQSSTAANRNVGYTSPPSAAGHPGGSSPGHCGANVGG